jgi:hypothetical protein
MIMAWHAFFFFGFWSRKPVKISAISPPVPELKRILAEALPCTLMEHLLLTERLYGPCCSTHNLAKDHYAAKSCALGPAQ